MAIDAFIPQPSAYNPDKALPDSITEPLSAGMLPTDGYAELLRFFWEEALKSADPTVPIIFIQDLINSTIALSSSYDRLASSQLYLDQNEQYRLRLIYYQDIIGYLTYQTPGTWTWLKENPAPDQVETSMGDFSPPPSSMRAQVVFDYVVGPLLYGIGEIPDGEVRGYPDAVLINRFHNRIKMSPEEAVNFFIEQLKSIVGAPVITANGGTPRVGSSLLDSFKGTISNVAKKIRTWWDNLKAATGRAVKEIPGIMVALGLGIASGIIVKMMYAGRD